MLDEHAQPQEVPHADIELCDRLRAVAVAGPVWDRVARELAGYGLSVMSAWVSTGVIASKCWEKGASLRTYFLGGCVLAFPNVLRQWRNDRRRYQQAATAFDGYALAEIAEILAMTPGAVNTALYRMRRHGPGSKGRQQ